MKKNFVLDTSVLIHDPSAFFNFKDNNIILPYMVVHEIDGLRKAPNGRGHSAREVIRQIDQFSNESSDLKNISLGEDKGEFSIYLEELPQEINYAVEIPKSLRDDIIIKCVKKLQENFHDVVFVSKDIGQRIKASVQGINAQDYMSSKVKDVNIVYKGLHEEVIVVPPPVNGDPYHDLIDAPEGILENEYCYVKFDTYDTIDPILYRKKGNKLIIIDYYKQGVSGIKPFDDHQRMALDALMDDNIKIVAISGVAGSGKTILSLASAIDSYKNGKIKTLMYVKPIVPVGGRDLGYLPGDKDEKLANWTKPLFDNLKVIEMNTGEILHGDFQGENNLEIELEAYTYMRGRTIHDTFVILDETQNCVFLEMRTALSRMGEKTKCVILADTTQIDNPYVDAESCGFSRAVESLKDHPLFASVHLEKSKRSDISKLVAERMTI